MFYFQKKKRAKRRYIRSVVFLPLSNHNSKILKCFNWLKKIMKYSFKAQKTKIFSAQCVLLLKNAENKTILFSDVCHYIVKNLFF